jgi:AraC-like DNA-binding protein
MLDGKIGQARPMVATVLDPRERPRLDAAAGGRFTTIHADTIPDAIRAVRERPVAAVLLSAGYLSREQVPTVARLVKAFPAVHTVAVVSRHEARASERLLELGASGVRTMVDLSQRDGWVRLRDQLTHPTSPASARILGRIVPELAETPEDCRLCFEVMIRLAPSIATVRGLCRRFRRPPSTVVSRFFRAGLPSPKRYLARVRLLYVAGLLETRGLSIADVVYRMEYSSPQSFGRHLRALAGLTASEFRRRMTLDRALEAFREELIDPFRAVLRAFHPLETQGHTVTGHSAWDRAGGAPADHPVSSASRTSAVTE